MPSPTRRSRPKAGGAPRGSHPRADEILSGAAAIFSKTGFAATSMREVARETGASLGSIYYHFENKEAILQAILANNFRRVEASVVDRLEGIDDPREALELFIENHISFFSQHLAEMKVMSHELDTLDGDAGAEVRQLRRAYTKRARDILRQLRPDLAQSDLQVATLSLFGMLNWTYRWYDKLPKNTKPERLAHQMGSIFLDGYLGT